MADDASSPPLQDVWYKLNILHAEWVNEKVGTRRKSKRKKCTCIN